MSIQVYESDNLNIIAGKGETLSSASCTTDGQLESETHETIRLHIQILVNGRIKNLFQQYNVVKEKGTVVGSPYIYQLETYHGFNTLVETLNQLGYQVQDIYGILEKAIDKLFTD